MQDNPSPTAYQRWSQTVAGMLACQLTLVETQCEVGFKLVEAALRIPSSLVPGSEQAAVAATTVDPFPALEALALERVKKGLTLPREIYEAPYRDRVDWFRFPEWARPTDPELFTDSGHEG